MMLESAASWRIVELGDGTRVVVDPDGVIVGTTDAPATSTLEPTATPTTPVSPAEASSTPAADTPSGAAAGGVVDGTVGLAVGTAAAVVAPVAPAAASTLGQVGQAVAGAAGTAVSAVLPPISFDTSGLADLSDLLTRASDGIEAELDRLAETAKSLSGSWSGDTDRAFRDAHREWTKRLDELHRILRDSSHLTREVEESLVKTETKIQDLWS